PTVPQPPSIDCAASARLAPISPAQTAPKGPTCRGHPAPRRRRADTGGMELLVVPWAPGPLIRIEPETPGDDLRRRSGLPLDGSDPDVGALVDAYEAVLATSSRGEPAVIAAHFALLETASLLRWAAPA